MPIGFGQFRNSVSFGKEPLAHKKSKKLECRVCNRPDSLTNMFAPCDCYKKREDGLVHHRCLEKLIELHQQRHDTSAKPRCPVCNKEFRGLKRHQIVWSRLCSEKGFDVIFQFVTMFIMMVCCIFVGGLVYYDETRPDDPNHPRHHKHMSQGEQRGFLVMGLLMVLMFVATLKKVHERWTRIARPLVPDYSRTKQQPRNRYLP